MTGSSRRSGDARPHVVLVGMMGSGKTTVGRQVAERLGRPFLDSDDEIMRRTGRTVREIFEADGEEAFRRLETEVLLDALGSPAPSVIAAAGGSVLRPANRAALRTKGVVVWLRADPATLAGRVRHADHRPLLRDDPSGVLNRLSTERARLYAEVAHEVVDVDTVPPDAVVDAIVKLVVA